MTLGRSSSGAIKIKTDGGLRAVECACCGGGGCVTTITEAQFNQIRFGGTANIAGNFPETSSPSYYQIYDYSTPLDNGDSVFGACKIDRIQKIKNTGISQCVYTYPEGGPSGTYSVNNQDKYIEILNIEYLFYNAFIPSDPSQEGTYDISAAVQFEGICEYCDGEPDAGIKVKHRFYLNQVLCGQDLWEFIKEASTEFIPIIDGSCSP